MAAALEQVVKQLADSGIISAGKLENFVPPKANPKDAEELVRELIKQNVLTKFQAQHVLQNKAKALFLGNYTLLDRIGAGGMGQVFKAEHRRMKRLVAIKMLPSAVTKDPAAVARFQREVEAAARLRHPNIVAADDADEANGLHFLVMEYVDGKDLSALVKRDGPMPVDTAIDYIRQAATALAFAHGEGVVHRDIKPSNLLLDKKGTVKILDMGLARIDSQGDVGAQAELTGTGAVMGTVDYMAPEQALSTKHADARADIYSLGCSLHYLLTGKPTYDGETITAKLLAHHHHPIPNLCQLRGEVPEPLQAVFSRMVAKKIEDRYQTMNEVAADLAACQGAAPASSSMSQITMGLGKTVDPAELSIALANQPLKAIDLPDSFRIETVARTPLAPPGKAAAGEGVPPWKNRKVLIAGGGAFALLLLLGVIVIIRNNKGEEITRIEAPAGSTVEVKAGTGQANAGGPNNPLLPPGEGGRRPDEGAADRAAAQYLIDEAKAHLSAVRARDGARLDLFKSSQIPDEDFSVTDVKFPRGNKPPAEAIRLLPELKRLDTLNFSGCPVTEADLKPLDKLAQLRHLDLAYTEITATALLILRNQHSLVDLWLNNSKVDPKSCIAFAAAQPQLRWYDGNWDEATRASYLPPASLRRLSMPEIDDKVAARIGTWNQLTYLSVNASGKLTERGFQELCKLKNLTSLSANNGTHVANAWLVHLLPLSELTRLDLGQSEITDAGLDSFARLLKLTYLSLGKSNVTSAGMEKLHLALPACKINWHGGTIEPRTTSPSPGTAARGLAWPPQDETPGEVATRRIQGVCYGLAMFPDGRRIAVTDKGGIVRVYDFTSGQLLWGRAIEGTPTLMQVLVSGDGLTIAVAGRYESHPTVYLLKASSGGTIRKIDGDKSGTYALALSPDGKLLATGGEQGGVTLWDRDSGKSIRSFTGHVTVVQALAFSPDGTLLASGDAATAPGDKKGTGVKLWDVVTGKPIDRLKPSSSTSYQRLQFSADGAYLLAGITNTAATIWDIATGTVTQIGNPVKGISSRNAVFLPSGRHILFGTTSLTLGTIAPNKILDQFGDATLKTSALIVTPDGRFAISGSESDGTLHIWQMPREAWSMDDGAVWLDDMNDVEQKYVAFSLGRHGFDQSHQPIDWHGKQPAHALFEHPYQDATAVVTFALDGKYDEFRATAGLAKRPDRKGVVTFRVMGDDQQLWASPPMEKQQEGLDVNLSVRGIDRLRLEVHCDGDAHSAHAVWIDPRLTPAIAASGDFTTDVLLLGGYVVERWNPQVLSESFPNVRIKNRGKAGDTTGNILTNSDAGNYADVRPKVVVVQAGSGELAGGAKRAAEYYSKMVKTLRTSFPQSTLVLSSAIQTSSSSAALAGTVQLNAEIAKLANGQAIRFVDLDRVFLDGNQLRGDVISGTSITPLGYERWGDALRPMLTELLATSAPLAPGGRGAGGEGAGFALDFNGKSAFVKTPFVYDGKTPLTVEAFVTLRSSKPLEAVICDENGKMFGGFKLNHEALWWHSTLMPDGKPKSAAIPAKDKKTPDTIHLAGVFDNGEERFYIDGKLQGSKREPFRASTYSMVIGGNPAGERANDPFDGTIDEVRISSVARYTGEFTPQKRFDADEHTEALYHFDEGSGEVAKDASPHGRDGKIIDATWVATSASGRREPAGIVDREAGASRSSAGWIEAFNGTDLSGWIEKPAGCWKVGTAVEDPDKPNALNVEPSGHDLVRPIEAKQSDIYTEAKWGDVQVELEFLFPKSSNSGVFLMGEYEINLHTGNGSGAILKGPSPAVDARKPAGEWQTLSIDFRAPRFEGDKKVANARFVRVVYNGQVIHENVELKDVTKDGSCLTSKESSTGPLLLQGTLGCVAYRNIRIRPLDVRTLGQTQILTSPDYEWSEPENLGPTINDFSTDADPAISGDGLTLIFSSPRSGTLGNLDLWITLRKSVDEPFGTPQNLGPAINSTSNENGCRLSADGLTLTFASDRDDSKKMFQLFQSTRPSRAASFGPATPLTALNSTNQDLYAALSGDGRLAVLSSARSGGGGGHDIWQATREGPLAEFTAPTPLGPPVNSTAIESGPWISADGRVLLFHRKTNSSANDGEIWMAVRPSPSEPFAEPLLVEPPISLARYHEGGASVTADGRLIFFSSSRPGGRGGQDIWMSHRVPRSGVAASLAPGESPGVKVWQTPVFEAWVKATQALPAEQQLEAVSKKLMELNPGFDGKLGSDVAGQGTTNPSVTGQPKIEKGGVIEVALLSDTISDISPVRGFAGLKRLVCWSSGPRTSRFSDLSPLAGMELRGLTCTLNPVRDLSPLRGMPLTIFSANGCREIADVSPLAGMPLQSLRLQSSQVRDLTPLETCNDLNDLDLYHVQISADQVTALQKALPKCKIKWGDPSKPAPSPPPSPARGERDKAWESPAFQKWIAETQKLPAEQQIEAVSKKLMELNPGFDGKFTGAKGTTQPKIENGKVTELRIVTDKVADIWPVVALTGLKSLNCSGSGGLMYYCALADISPLAGMKLERLEFNDTQVADLTPLRGMPLVRLSCFHSKVSDLSPLKGIALEALSFHGSPISDLSPLAGMPLTDLVASYSRIKDASPLATCKQLKSVQLGSNPVTAESIGALQKALPNCKISWDDKAGKK
ncbi:MAG TPA: protein kinase [Pirellulales bacterium]|nr:protein kinase [Pirellulales bacterium]